MKMETSSISVSLPTERPLYRRPASTPLQCGEAAAGDGDFDALLAKLGELDITGRYERLGRIHYDWIEACERTHATVRLLSEQLRRFLDDQVWLENRRVLPKNASTRGA